MFYLFLDTGPSIKVKSFYCQERISLLVQEMVGCALLGSRLEFIQVRGFTAQRNLDTLQINFVASGGAVAFDGYLLNRRGIPDLYPSFFCKIPYPGGMPTGPNPPASPSHQAYTHLRM